MDNKKIIKNVLLALVLAVLLVAVYAGFKEFTSDDESSLPVGSLTSLLGTNQIGQIQEQEVVVENADILRVLGSIQGIRLEDGIFNNPVFLELKDSRFTIPRAKVQGRANPFRPVGIERLEKFTNPSSSSNGTTEEAGPDVSGFFGGINS